MQIWIEVLDASGNRYGNGAIRTAANWQRSTGLDQAGGFSFTMPAADPMAQYVTNKRHVHCYGATEDAAGWPEGIQDLGAGIIEQIELQPGVKGPAMLQVSGTDLMQELANVTVGDLKLYLDDAQAPESVKHVVTGDPGSSTLWAPGDTIDLQTSPLSYIVVRSQEAFFRITCNLSSPFNAAVATLKAQFYNDDSEPAGWENVPITDGTRVEVSPATDPKTYKPLAQDGVIEFDPPAGWNKTTYGGYEIRLYSDEVDLGNVRFSGITVTVRKPTLTALQDTMALAPAGWSLDPTGKLETEQHLAEAARKGVYLEMTKQSVLATLGTIGEQLGEHFILSPSGRRVLWIGTDKTASGLRAIGPVEPDATLHASTFGVRSITRTWDSKPLFTRIYPAGGGTGEERITLSDATDTAPAGYTMDADAGWLQLDSAVATYGRIDNPVDYPDIVALDNSHDAQAHAGNALLKRAYEALARGALLQEGYSLSLVPAQYPILPGQTIYVSYHKWVDGYHEINIEAELWVLGVETAVTASGDIYTVGLDVALVDTYPTFDGKRTAEAITAARTSRAQRMPEGGLTDNNIGEIAGLYVKNGKITQVNKKKPIVPYADGAYPPDWVAQTLKQITIQDGRIIGLEYRDN